MGPEADLHIRDVYSLYKRRGDWWDDSSTSLYTALTEGLGSVPSTYKGWFTTACSSSSRGSESSSGLGGHLHNTYK